MAPPKATVPCPESLFSVFESALESGPEEDQQETHERREDERNDLMLPPVGAPVVERCSDVGLARWVVSKHDQPRQEDEPSKRTGEREKASKAIRRHDSLPSPIPSRLLLVAA